MTDSIALTRELGEDVCRRALVARDPRFDGLFFVGITSTRIYCRPVCPARVSYPSHRRFFSSAASAERAGFRPCLRCRPELAPGCALIDAVPRLARVAAQRISAGALNGRAVGELARDLGVSERHLRRALEREIGVSPVDLALTHRLLLAKQLLVDTDLSVTRIAFASGFQSLRRFNSVLLERYGLSPSEIRRAPRVQATKRPRGAAIGCPETRRDAVRLTLAYRAPFAWKELLSALSYDALPGVEAVRDGCYWRTIKIGEARGVVAVQNTAASANHSNRAAKPQLDVEISASLVPQLMPLLARLRQLFDLDAEPTAVDAHLRQSGLAVLIDRHPGLRIPGSLDGFEVALRVLLGAHARSQTSVAVARKVVDALGEEIPTESSMLTRLAPTAERVATAGADRLADLGVSRRRARVIASIACVVARGTVRLEPGTDAAEAHAALLAIEGVDDRLAAAIVMRALRWPDAFPATDRALLRLARAPSPQRLASLSEKWRPWRSYAFLHLELAATERAIGV